MRNKCIVCGADFWEKPLFICENMPAESQNLPRKEDLDKERPIDYRLYQCSGCGLVQFDGEPVEYYLDSTRAGERCEILINMRRAQYKHIIETYDLQGKKILEIGAGKGGFLKTLQEMIEYRIRGYGLEHNPNFVRTAREVEGVEVIQGNPEDASLKLEEAPFDAFFTFAYPARLVHPNAMLQLASNNLKQGGIGLVQVPSLEHLLKPGGYYDITRDHIAYYNQDTLRFLLQKNGFDVLEHGEVGGVYIYAIVKKRMAMNVAAIWEDVRHLADEVTRYVQKATENNKKLAVWCAGHFAFTVLATTGIGHSVSYIIDNAKFKQGCFAPASHVPIFGPEHFREEPVDTILILGPIYVNEIVDEIRKKCPSAVKIAAMGRDGLKEII